MTVENRKLFANRDARRRLSEMGGIMASSPELLGEAQMYADGGRVIPGDMPPLPQNQPMGQQIGNALGNFFQPIGQGMRDTMQPMGQAIREGLGSSYSTGPLEALLAAGAAENAAATTPTTNRLSREDLMTQTQPITIDYMGSATTVYVNENGDIFDASGQNMMFTVPRSDFENIVTKVNQTLQREVAAQTRTQEREAAAARSAFEKTGSGADLAAATAAEAAVANPPEARTVAPDPIELARIRGAQAEGRDVFAEEGPGATGLSGQVAPAPAAEQPTGPDLTAIAETISNPDLSPSERNAAASTQVLAGVGVPDAENLSVRDRVKAYEEMFKEMLGEKDEDVAKEMWHNMAMIGFAIAAGENPNALQNISQGLLAGTKMMREDRATRQAREDKIRMMAISEGLSDERAAERLASAERIAAMRSTRDRNEVGVAPNPLVAINAIADTYRETYGREPSAEEVTAAENNILRRYSRSQIVEGAPQYLDRWTSLTQNTDAGAGGGTGTGATSDLASMAAAEAAAKAAGQTEFVYNGMRYPVR